MYQMMIIDDETIVREGLKKLLPWEDYHFTICAEGTDGLDGLEKILRFQPNLVLIDVKMPGLNGIEVIRQAKEKGFKGTFIILTGYSDFEAAKSAVSLGVREYVLKPIDEDELALILDRIKNELDEESKHTKYIQMNEKDAKQEILRRLLLYIEDKNLLKTQMQAYGMKFHSEIFCTAILSNPISEPGSLVEYPSVEKLSVMLHGIEGVTGITIEDKWVLISDGHSYDELLKKLMVNNEKVKNVYGDSYFISMGHNVTHWMDLHYSYECAKALCEYQFTYQRYGAITIKAMEEMTDVAVSDLQEKLCSYIEIGDMGGVEAGLKKLREYCKVKLLKEAEVKLFVTQLLFRINMTLREHFNEKAKEFPKDDIIAVNVQRVDTYEELNLYITAYMKKLSTIIANNSSDTVIKRIMAYIDRNYGSDLKLDSIAKMFNYNSAYLGKVFKKETGENFNNYLDHIRIEHAKQLLSETNLKVYQVSEKVGLSNIDYFYAKFKRYVGISPKEFAKNHNAETDS